MKGFLQIAGGAALVSITVACASTPAASRPSANVERNPDLIATAEIEGQSFRDAYDIVQRLRPTWLTRKADAAASRRMGVTVTTSPTGQRSGIQSGAAAGLLVYLDKARLGGIETLRELSIGNIKSIQFMDASAAMASLPGVGSSVITGAIIVHSRTGS